MIPIAYSILLSELTDAMGWNSPDGSPNLNSQQWHSAKRALSKAMGLVWERAYWRDLLVNEERWFAPAWDPDETVSAGAVRFHSLAGLYYLALEADPGTDPAQLVDGKWESIEGGWTEAGLSYDVQETWDVARAYWVGDRVIHPDTGVKYQCVEAHTAWEPPTAAYWGELVAWSPAVDKYQSGRVVIGKVEGVYNVNPHVYPGARRSEFVDNGSSLAVRSLERNSVWVRHLVKIPQFTGDLWSPLVAYTPGAGGAITVDDMSGRQLGIPGRVALRARTLHANMEIVVLLYLTVEDDASGGDFIFKAGSSAADNGVDVIKPDDIPAGSPGRWHRSLNLT